MKIKSAKSKRIKKNLDENKKRKLLILALIVEAYFLNITKKKIFLF